MTTPLDLEEQEQLEELKHFWKRWGNLITWVAIAVLASYAGWNGYKYWRNTQAAKAAVLYEEIERASVGGDLQKLERAWSDIKDKAASATYTSQAGLLVSKVFLEANRLTDAQLALEWVSQNAPDAGYVALSKLRLSGIYSEQKKYAEAQKLLAGEFPPSFVPLIDDRLGDLYWSQNQADLAKESYLKSWKAMEPNNRYRDLVAVKLSALGVNTEDVKP